MADTLSPVQKRAKSRLRLIKPAKVLTTVGQATPDPRLLGGRLCLDFANTVDPRHGDRPYDFLATYADLVRWAERAGAMPADAPLAPGPPGDRVTATLEAARTLRDQLYRVFSRIAAEAQPDPADLDALARAHARAAAHARIVPARGGLRWAWDEDLHATDRMLWPIARDAADLLTTGRLDRIRECPGADGCGWLFYDTSRNGRRRWCSMEGCGNRVKGRRHYHRHGARTPPG
jgi:predicted RNA-binding Zn ribbon-like protein